MDRIVKALNTMVGVEDEDGDGDILTNILMSKADVLDHILKAGAVFQKCSEAQVFGKVAEWLYDNINKLSDGETACAVCVLVEFLIKQHKYNNGIKSLISEILAE